MNEAYMPINIGEKSQSPSRIVIHAMAEFINGEDQTYYAVDWIRKCNLSVHAFVTPSGVVIRSRKDHEGAWHAREFNPDSLGVEFIVPGVHTEETFMDAIKTEYLTDIQYKSGLVLVKKWKELFGITRIERHSDLSPGRKVDPGD